MPPRTAKKSAKAPPGPKRAAPVRVVAVKDKPVPPTQRRRRRRQVHKGTVKKIEVVEVEKKKIIFEEPVLVFEQQMEEEEEEEEPSETEPEWKEEEEEPSETEPQEEEEEPSETEPEWIEEEEEEPSETEPEWKEEEEEPSETEPQKEEEEPSETGPEWKEEEEEEEEPLETEPELKPEPSRYVSSLEEEDNVKESSDEDDKDERLEPEDNEVEYEPEEDISLDYDEKEIEDEDVEEEEDGGGKEAEEEDVGEEKEDDLVEEQMEDVPEEIQDDEDEENAVEEHEVVVDRENEEHHEVVKERRKVKEFEVFVGGLDRDATEDDLKKIFSAVGEITEVRLMMNPQTKKNKGFAFLRFATVEQADRAVTEMKKPVVNGKQCRVSPCQDRDTLFLGNICKTWTKEALKEKLKHYGISNVEDFTLVEDSKSEGMNRGFAFLEFSSRLEAVEAYKRLQKRDVVFGVDRTAKVAFADSFSEPDDEIMAQVKRVFVDGLPASWDEDHVKNHLKSFGEIQKIELARNKPSAKRKDYGYVTFGSHNEAVACAEAINKSELGEGDNKKKVRAILSKPGQRVRRKHDHGDFRPGRRIPHGIRGSKVRPPSSSFSVRGSRGNGARFAPPHGRGFKRPSGFRGRRPGMVKPERAGPLPRPVRSYSRRPIPSYPKSSSKRAYGRKDELSPRSRAAVDYDTRAPKERTSSYRDEYFSRGSGYSDEMPHIGSPTTSRRGYADESYDRRFEKLPPSYRKGHSRDYDYIPGSKRQYSALDDVPPRYADASARQSRARLDYEVGGSSSSQYVDTYRERLGRSHLGGYGGSRSSLSVQESHGIYGSRRAMGYDGGSSGGNDVCGTYSSSLGSEYMSQGPDVGDSSYSSSLYSHRSLGGSSYMGNGGSGSYY